MNTVFLSIWINLFAALSSQSPSIHLMSFNIRYDNPDDGINRWENRKEMVIDVFEKYQPDIIGLQEVLNGQLKYVTEQLPEYSYIGVGRDDGKERGEYSPILYRNTRFKIKEGSTFWLSATPDCPSKGWDAALERICTFVLLQDTRTGKFIWVLNTHFDHIGIVARENSAKLIIEKMGTLKRQFKCPVVVMGDLNSEVDDKAFYLLRSIFADTREISKTEPVGSLATFNAFNFEEPARNRIDYIFVEMEFVDVLNFQTINDSSNGRYPSDHFPVFAEIKMH